MDKIFDDINSLFINYADVENKIPKKKNIKTRNKQSKIKSLDALEYFFHYTNINSTKLTSIALTNIANKHNYSRSSYERHIKQIPLDIFIKLHKDVIQLYKKHIGTDSKINKILNGYDHSIDHIMENFVATDGVCGNEVKNNKLFTNQNLCFLDMFLNIPVDFIENNEIYIFDNNKNNITNKNHESVIFSDYLDKNKDNDKIKNKIYVNDRAYFSYQLVDKIVENKNNNFIFRVKDNLDILDKNANDGDCKKKNINAKNKKDIKIKNMIINDPNIRIIKYTSLSQKVICKKKKKIKKNKKKKNSTNDGKNSKDNNESMTLNIEDSCYVITNLPSDIYSNDIIQLLYRLRWNIEVYFKYMKDNFKFDTIYLDDKNEILKLKYSEMIIFILNKLVYIKCLEETYKKNPKKFSNTVKNKKTGEIKHVSVRINTSLSINGFYDLVLHHIIRGTLTNDVLKNYDSQYLKIIRNEIGRSFPRESLQSSQSKMGQCGFYEQFVHKNNKNIVY